MKNIFNRIGIIVEHRYSWVMLTSILLIFVALAGASSIKMESGTETMISTDAQAYKDYHRFNRDFGSDTVVILVTGNDLSELLEPQNLKAYASVEQQLNATQQYPDIISVVGPPLLFEQVTGWDISTIEDSAPLISAAIDPDTGEIKSSLSRVLPDKQHTIISIVIKPEMKSDDIRNLMDDLEEVVKNAGFSDKTDAVITGTPAAMSELEDMMMTSLSTMFLTAIGLLLIVLALIFKVRGFFAWRWLPLGVVLVGSIYTFGTMGFIGVGLSMVTMAVFPILIGLGIDYGIQVHNRYDEETFRGESAADAIIDSITHIGPAIGIALVAGCLGFAALFFSPVPMIQDFGLLLIVGVIAAYIVALFPLPGILYFHDRRNHKKGVKVQNNTGIVEKSIGRMAPWVINNPLIILPIALTLTVGGLLADSHIDTATDETAFIDESTEPMRNLNALREVVGGTTTLNLLFESETSVATPAMLNWMDEFEAYLVDPGSGYQDEIAQTNSIARIIKQENDGIIPQTGDEIARILSDLPNSMKKNLVSDDQKAANLSITLVQMDDAETGQIVDRLKQGISDRETPESALISLTGNPVIKLKVVDAITSGRQTMTFLGLLLIFAGLVILFRLRPIRALLATLPILLIVGWSALVMYVMGIEFTPLTATLGALIMGVGVEYTILVMSRYYEEREKGEQPVEAMTTALTRIGRAVTVSALTTIGGFAALLIARDFPILQDFGIVTLINVFFALVVSMAVLPSMIVKVDTLSERYPILKRL